MRRDAANLISRPIRSLRATTRNILVCLASTRSPLILRCRPTALHLRPRGPASGTLRLTCQSSWRFLVLDTTRQIRMSQGKAAVLCGARHVERQNWKASHRCSSVMPHKLGSTVGLFGVLFGPVFDKAYPKGSSADSKPSSDGA